MDDRPQLAKTTTLGCEDAARLDRENELIADARERGWEREVERHQATQRPWRVFAGGEDLGQVRTGQLARAFGAHAQAVAELKLGLKEVGLQPRGQGLATGRSAA